VGIRDLFKKSRTTKTATALGPPSTGPSTVAPQAAQSPGNPGVTKIEREHFHLHAPFQWVAVPGDNPLEFEFRNQTLREQLIVTLLLPREPLAAAKLQMLAEDFGNKRLSALATLSNGRAVHSPLRIQSGSGQAEARCLGADDSHKVRFAFVVRVAPAKVVTVALTRYFMEEVGSPFDVYASSIFDFLQVKNPGGSTGG
jgi:hypothetical protein